MNMVEVTDAVAAEQLARRRSRQADRYADSEGLKAAQLSGDEIRAAAITRKLIDRQVGTAA